MCTYILTHGKFLELTYIHMYTVLCMYMLPMGYICIHGFTYKKVPVAEGVGGDVVNVVAENLKYCMHKISCIYGNYGMDANVR